LSRDKYSRDKIKNNQMGGACSTYGGEREERRIVYRILAGKSDGQRPLGRRRRRWEKDIKMALQNVGWGGMDCIELAQDRDRWEVRVNTAMNCWVT
jgi:hypothetical protein